jgi:MazG family protein
MPQMSQTSPRPIPPPSGSGAHFADVVQLMNRLLAEDGCPWDREQTLDTLRPFLLEEAHEVLEALEQQDVSGHREELGDLLFQIVFQAALRERQGEFDIDAVCDHLVDKMTRRHPHVFGDAAAASSIKDAADQLRAWQVLKQEEKKAAGKVGRTLDGVPVALPALLRAQRLGEKAARVGFDWPDLDGVRQKVTEELRELDEAMATGEMPAMVHELGDLLFTLTRLAAKLGIAPEDALRQANVRFCRRFTAMEDSIHSAGQELQALNLDEMNQHWEQVKKQT